MKKIILVILNLYQQFVAPFLGVNCRFFPSCSEYAKIAVREKGVLKGAMLIIRRILKCHPLHEGGYDPVT